MTQHGSPVYYGLPEKRNSFSFGEKLLSHIVWSWLTEENQISAR